VGNKCQHPVLLPGKKTSGGMTRAAEGVKKGQGKDGRVEGRGKGRGGPSFILETGQALTGTRDDFHVVRCTPGKGDGEWANRQRQ